MNLFEQILNKIKLLNCRGAVTDIDNTGAFQKIQAVYLPEESIDEIERLQEYGFESYPPIENTECFTTFFNGNRDSNRGKVLSVHNKVYRPKDLDQGDVCVYAKDTAKGNKNRITIKATGEILIETFAGDKIEIKSTGEINITASVAVNVNGNSHPAIFGDDLVTAFDTWTNLWKSAPVGTSAQNAAAITLMQNGVAALIALLTASKSTKVKVG